jgi:hypothetical protein
VIFLTLLRALMFQDGPLLQAAPNRSSFFTQVNILTVRSFKNMYRDLGYYWLRLGIYVALCICIGTVFYKVGTGYSAIQVSKLRDS